MIRSRLPCARHCRWPSPACSLAWPRRCRPQAQAVPHDRPDAAERVLLTAGRSTVLATDFDITRIAVTNPAVADAVVVSRAKC